MIEEHHDKASGKPSKQLANLPTFPNPLIIKPLGVDRHSRIWWQIDGKEEIIKFHFGLIDMKDLKLMLVLAF